MFSNNCRILKYGSGISWSKSQYFPLSNINDNDYVPVFIVDEATQINNKEDGIQYSLYIDENHITDRLLNRILQHLYNHNANSILYNLNSNMQYYSLRHCVFHFKDKEFMSEPEILLLLIVESEYVLNFLSKSFEEQKTINTDETKFKLLVSKELDNNPSHAQLSRKLKAYIKNIMEKNVDVIYTDDVIKYAFKSSIKQPKFKKVSEMIEFQKELLNF